MLKEALEIHNHLNPALWNSKEELLPEVEDRLIQIVNKFKSECMLPLDIVDVHLVGSNASFNYTSHSDLDVHIVVNFDLLDCDKEILVAAYNLQKAQFNKEYDISIRGIDVELYIEDINSNTMSNGIYSLYEKKWIKKPQPIQVPDIDVSNQVNQLADKIRNILCSEDSIEVTKTINMLYMMRKNSLATTGEFGRGNLIFKGIRDLGLLDGLKERLKELQSQELTLEQINENLIVENYYYELPLSGGYKLFTYSENNKKSAEVFNRNLNSVNLIDPSILKVTASMVNKCTFTDAEIYANSIGVDIKDVFIGDLRHAGSEDSIKYATKLLGGLPQGCNNLIVHHIDKNETNVKHTNLIAIPYNSNYDRYEADLTHKIIENSGYDPARQSPIIFREFYSFDYSGSPHLRRITIG